MKYPEYMPDALKKHFDLYLYEIDPNGNINKDSGIKPPLGTPIDVIKRLITDTRMKPLYRKLQERLDDNQLEDFIYTCWACSYNFQRVRSNVKYTKKLLKSIHKTTLKLSCQLKQLSEIEESSIWVSEDLNYLPKLIDDSNQHGDILWSMKKKDITHSSAWSAGPSTQDLIDTIANKAKHAEVKTNFSVYEDALLSREGNPKQDYLRALFSRILDETKYIDGLNWYLDDVIHLIPEIASVILDDIIVEDIDVNNALKNVIDAKTQS